VRTSVRTAVASLVLIFVAALAVTSGRAQTPARLTSEDYAEILQLYFKYPIALDSGDAEGYANLFTDDGSFGNRVGRAALIDFVRTRAKSTVRHAPLTPMITATPDGARGIVMNMFIDVGQSPAVITRVSQYTDTLVKTPSGWRFKTRVNGSADLTGGAGTPARGRAGGPN
jgi:hypothetical protein